MNKKYSLVILLNKYSTENVTHYGDYFLCKIFMTFQIPVIFVKLICIKCRVNIECKNTHFKLFIMST